jgi:hypothetical protein
MKISITPGRYTTLILKEVNNQKAGRRVAEHLRILHRIGPSTKGSTNTTRGQDSRGKPQDQMKPQGLVTMKISITRGRYTTLILKEVDNQKAGRRVAEHVRILHRTGPPTKGSTNTTKGPDQ